MPNDKAPWFISERSKALVSLLLMSKQDVHVRSEQENDNGVVLFVEIDRNDPFCSRRLVVQVKGALSSDKNEWKESVNQLLKRGPLPFWLVRRSSGVCSSWGLNLQPDKNRFQESGFEDPLEDIFSFLRMKSCH